MINLAKFKMRKNQQLESQKVRSSEVTNHILSFFQPRDQGQSHHEHIYSRDQLWRNLLRRFGLASNYWASAHREWGRGQGRGSQERGSRASSTDLIWKLLEMHPPCLPRGTDTESDISWWKLGTDVWTGSSAPSNLGTPGIEEKESLFPALKELMKKKEDNLKIILRYCLNWQRFFAWPNIHQAPESSPSSICALQFQQEPC